MTTLTGKMSGPPEPASKAAPVSERKAAQLVAQSAVLILSDGVEAGKRGQVVDVTAGDAKRMAELKQARPATAGDLKLAGREAD